MGFSIGRKRKRKKNKLYIASTTIMHKNFDGLLFTTTMNDDRWNTLYINNCGTQKLYCR